jgi:hypothetical protein
VNRYNPEKVIIAEADCFVKDGKATKEGRIWQDLTYPSGTSTYSTLTKVDI